MMRAVFWPARWLVAVVVVVVVGGAGCPIGEELLPGRPCERASDCGDAFACVRVPGRETSVCVAQAAAEEVVGCDGAGDGDSCGDGDGCTEGDVCSGGVCSGVAKDCGDDLCVDGSCVVVGSCEALPATVATSAATTPRLAYNPIDDEIGLVFEAPVLERTEVFFTRLSGAGVPRGAPVQLTDGTPATADDADVSSFVRDIAFAPEEQRYGVLVADSQILGGGVSLVAITNDGIVVKSTRLVRELASGFALTPARLVWNGAEFIMAATTTGQNDDSIVVDDVNADGDGADLIDSVVAAGFFAELDIAAGNAGEVGIVAVGTDVDGNAVDIQFFRADADGSPLVDRVLSTGRGPGRSPQVAAVDGGYVVVWQEGVDDGLQLVAVALDDAGAIVVPARVISDAGERGQVAGLGGAGDAAYVAYFATVDGTFSIRLRRLARDLTAAAPTTLRAGLDGGFAPSVDAAAGSIVTGYGAGNDAGEGVDVEVARVCE